MSNLALPKGTRVLVVDGDLDSRDLLATVFDGYEATTVLASSASECIAKIQEAPPDLIVCEIALPDEDGYSLMGRIKALEVTQGIRLPAIALTIYASDDARNLALAAGFSSHLSKPVDMDKLLEAAIYAIT